MTLPGERSLAQKAAGNFLKKIRNSSELPDDLREEAEAILRHYPDHHQIDLLAEQVARAEAMPGLHVERQMQEVE